MSNANDNANPVINFINTKPGVFFVALVLAVIAVWGTAFLIIVSVTQETFQESGQLGDSFGILNTLFSGLAFAAIVAALFLQRNDVQNSLQEIRQTGATQRAQLALAERARAEATETLARFFQAEKMIDARKHARLARAGWFNGSDEEKKRFTKLWFDIDEMTNSEDDTSWPNCSPWPTSLLIDYYCSLYYHLNLLDASSKKELGPVLANRFRWPYWRGYLLTLGKEVQSLYNDQLKGDEIARMHNPQPSWIVDLYSFDHLSGMPEYDRSKNRRDMTIQ